MPSTILSDNGVSSGSAGLKTTAASDGILVLQTSTSGGTATNAIYVDTSQNVGVNANAVSTAKFYVNGGSVAPTSGQVLRLDTTATTAYSATAYVGGQIRINYGNATSSYGGINFSNFGVTSQEFFGTVQNSSGYGDFVWQGYGSGGYLERARIDSSSNFQMNSGFGSVATAYGCRVWARVTGGGGSGGLPATSLVAGGNASSFVKNSTGQYTLNFTNAMPDTTYAVSTNQETGNVTFASTIVSYNQYTGSVQVVSDNNSVQADFRYGSIAVFR